ALVHRTGARRRVATAERDRRSMVRQEEVARVGASGGTESAEGAVMVAGLLYQSHQSKITMIPERGTQHETRPSASTTHSPARSRTPASSGGRTTSGAGPGAQQRCSPVAVIPQRRGSTATIRTTLAAP